MNSNRFLAIVVHDTEYMTRPPLVMSLEVLQEVGGCLRVALPWGEHASIGKGTVEYIFGWTGRVKVADQAALLRLHAMLCKGFASGGNGLIKVQLAGATPSGAAQRVRVDGVVYQKGKYSGDIQIKTHTVTVPAVHVQSYGERKYVCQWVLKRAVHQNILDGKTWPSWIEGGEWFGQEKLWETIFRPLEVELNEISVDRENRQARREAEAIKRQEQRSREVEEEKVRQAELALERAKAAKRSAKRRAKLETLHVAYAEWHSWEHKGGQWFKKINESAEDCILKFSGQRVYILLSGGREVVKTRANVRWRVDAACPEEQVIEQ